MKSVNFVTKTFSRSLFLTCALAITGWTGAGIGFAAHAESVKPHRTEDLRDSIGVNTHINYTDGAYANVPFVMDALSYLGVSHIRDSTPVPWYPGTPGLLTYDNILSKGIKANFGDNSGLDVAKTISVLSPLAKLRPNAIVSIEGLNEVDRQKLSYKGLIGIEAATAYQRDLYKAVKADPYLSNIPVFDYTGGDLKGEGEKQSLVGRADYLNFHVYAQNGSPPRQWFNDSLVVFNHYQQPSVITEFGYGSLPQSGWLMIGVDERSQAKGILNGIFDSYDLGFKRIFLYELVDQKPDPSSKDLEMHFGLFDNRFRKKTAATALRNLTRLLRDTSPTAQSFETMPLDYSLGTLPETAHTLLIQKTSGETYLVLWNEVLMWDRATGKPIPETPLSVSLKLEGGATIVAIHDPLDMEAQKKTVQPTSMLDVPLRDHPVLIEIKR
jgi:hypothetical protein